MRHFSSFHWPLRRHAVALVAAVLAAPALATEFVWTTGDFASGVTAPHPLLAGDTLLIQAGGSKRFVGGSFTNQGLVRWQADALQGGNSATVLNSGVWQTEADANTLTWAFGGQPTFTNTGTFRKSAGVNTNVGTWAFVNQGGLIDAQVGSITFNGNANQFNTGSRFAGAGGVTIDGNSSFSGTFQADALTLAGGTFTGSAASFSGGVGGGAGKLGWTGGDLAGNWTLGANGSFTASGNAAKRQVGSDITNHGLFVWNTTTQLQGGNSSVFTNHGTVEVRQSAAFNWNFGGAATYHHTASSTVRATNDATLTFGNGVLTSDGALFTADAGSAIVYSGGSNRFNDGTRFVGDHQSTGTSRFVGTIQSSGLRLVSGTHIGGDGSPGSSALLKGDLKFQGGDLQGAWVIDAGAVVTAEGASFKRQVGSTLTNNGWFVWDVADQLQGGNSSQFTNHGTIEARQSTTFNWNFGGAATYLNTATGRVWATNGATLTFGGGVLTSDGGQFTADFGSAIVYSGDRNRFNDGTRFVGDNQSTGTSRFVGTIHANGLRFVSGTQIGGDGNPGSFGVLQGDVRYQSGDLQGAWSFAAGSVVNADGNGAKRLVGGLVVNQGNVQWQVASALQTGNSSRIDNQGRYEFTDDGSITWNYGGQGQLDNSGLIIKTGGSGSSSLASVALSNTGMIDVRSGTILLPTGFQNAGTLGGTGTFALSGTLANQGHIAPGASTGTLSIAGGLSFGAGSFFDVELQGLVGHDLLLVSGNVALNGSLALRCIGPCAMAVGDEVVILDAAGQLTGTFADLTLSGFATGKFDVVYDDVQDRVLLRVTESVTPVPEPATQALMAGGLALLGWLARRRRAG